MEAFNALSDRERHWLIAGATVSSLLLFILLLWQPMTRDQARLEGQVAAKEKLLEWMQTAAEEARTLKAQGLASPDGMPLRQRIDRLARELGIAPVPQPQGPDGGLNLRLERVSFDRLLMLLDRAARAGARLQRLELTALPDSGYVRARLTLGE